VTPPAEKPADLPVEIAGELRPGETVQWTGRPGRRSLLFDIVPKSLIGVVLAAAGWYLLQHPVLPVRTRTRQSVVVPWALASAVTLLGFHVAVTRAWLVRRRRARTAYALTNRRAIIAARGGAWFSSYFLNASLETKFAGGGTIRFGGPRIGDKETFPTSIPEHLRSYAGLSDAAEVKMFITEQTSAHREFAPQSSEAFAPFARRVDPENQAADATIQRPPGGPLAYAEPVRAKLTKGETTLFVARPPHGILFRKMDWFVVPFALLWTAFACQWEWRALKAGCPAVFGLAFVAIGFYILVGRYFHDAHIRSKTWYAVTNRRCLIVTDGKIIETKSLYWNFIQGFARERHSNGSTTLHFELSALGRQDTPADQSLGGLRRPPGIYFERLADAEGVEAAILENVMPACSG
jgi:hypothetical protein